MLLMRRSQNDEPHQRLKICTIIVRSYFFSSIPLNPGSPPKLIRIDQIRKCGELQQGFDFFIGLVLSLACLVASNNNASETRISLKQKLVG